MPKKGNIWKKLNKSLLILNSQFEYVDQCLYYLIIVLQITFLNSLIHLFFHNTSL